MASVDGLLGSVLMVAPPDGWLESSYAWLDELQPAGIILFKRNLPDDFEAARAGIARLRAWAAARGDTLLVAMDEEGGFVTQTSAWMPTPPSARALAWAAEPDTTREVFTAYGKRLRQFGVDIDFAPVCDVNNNPSNPVIGVRSFGSDPQLVTSYALAVHEGLARGGVLSCAKHFPGHGDTDVDSHLALPVLHHDRAHLEDVELVPFRALLRQVPSVMVAHLACPQLGDDGMPATLSPRISTELLRRELRYDGVAFTDAMDMQGVAGQFGVEEAAVRSLLAGCDLLLYCFEIEKPQRAKAGLRAALESGRLPRARLDEAAARVERLKSLAAVGADSRQAAEPLPPAAVDHERHRELCRQALRLQNIPGWRNLSRRIWDERRVTLAGWQQEVLERLRKRLQDRGLDVTLQTPEMTLDDDAPQLVVLAERRPLDAERAAQLRQRAMHAEGVALANLLTPEIDAPLGEVFTTILRTADHSDAMLDVVVERLREMAQ